MGEGIKIATYDEKLAIKVSLNSIITNMALSLFKLFAGVFGHSGAMISDAVHSASDVFSTIIVMIGVKMAGKAADKNHQYGHERLECVAAIVLAVILCITGVGIGMNGVNKIVGADIKGIAIPSYLAMSAAIISIAVKEGMYWYTRAAAKKINSSALMADAWHHRSDALSSIGSFIGILGAKMGYPVFDPLASIVICIFIIKAAFEIFMDSIRKMTDESCDENIENEMKEVILSQVGVKRLDVFKTRKFGSRVYVDIEICADGNMTLREAHTIAENVHNIIEEKFPMAKHCMVHVNPYDEK